MTLTVRWYADLLVSWLRELAGFLTRGLSVLAGTPIACALHGSVRACTLSRNIRLQRRTCAYKDELAFVWV